MAELSLGLPSALLPVQASHPPLCYRLLPAASHLHHFTPPPLSIPWRPLCPCPLLPKSACPASTNGARHSSVIGADLNIPALHGLRSCSNDELKGFLFHALEGISSGLFPLGSIAAEDLHEGGGARSCFVYAATGNEGLDRGIFGVPTARKVQIEQLIELLEDRNPLPRPTENLDKVNGEWRLLYSTVTILGSKRTKLGLRGFVTLGDITQSLDIEQMKAVNIVMFHVAGLVTLSGSLTIESSYNVTSPTRVNVHCEKSVVTPEQLLNFFRRNYNLLLSIFNPEGWLEITYVDDSIRICRDDEGHIFLLGRDSIAN